MNERSKTMRGVWLTGHGDVDKLELRSDIPVPEPGPREVLVRVAAAGVNNTDINTRTGWYSKKDGASEDASWAGRPFTFRASRAPTSAGGSSRLGKGSARTGSVSGS